MFVKCCFVYVPILVIFKNVVVLFFFESTEKKIINNIYQNMRNKYIVYNLLAQVPSVSDKLKKFHFFFIALKIFFFRSNSSSLVHILE